MKREIRIPKQKRAIEKKRKLTEAAYQLFNERGYHNINTAEIAAEAGLSTGCFYDYFVDKDDVFLEAVKIHNEETQEIVRAGLKKLPNDMDLDELMERFLYIFMEAHNHSKGFHREVMALSLTNQQLAGILDPCDNPEIVAVFEGFFDRHGLRLTDPNEKVLLLLNTVDGTCHDLLYNKKSEVDEAIYIKHCAKMLSFMLTSK